MCSCHVPQLSDRDCIMPVEWTLCTTMWDDGHLPIHFQTLALEARALARGKSRGTLEGKATIIVSRHNAENMQSLQNIIAALKHIKPAICQCVSRMSLSFRIVWKNDLFQALRGVCLQSWALLWWFACVTWNLPGEQGRIYACKFNFRFSTGHGNQLYAICFREWFTRFVISDW